MIPIINYLDNFYRELSPSWSELDEKTRDLLFEGVSINSSYTSQLIEPTVRGQQRTQVIFLIFLINI